MGKILELEGVRGIAALLVVVHHSMLAFTPRLIGLVDSSPYSIYGTIGFALINGNAAVVVFFVLSGFVLTQNSLSKRSLSLLASTAIRRWPRLALPVLISNIAVAFALLIFGFPNREAASFSKSTWLGWWYRNQTSIDDIWQAAYEGAFATFINGSAYYNSSLWTMYYEFLGSFMSLVVATMVIAVNRRLQPLIIVLAWIVATLINPYFGCFIAGVALARIHLSERISLPGIAGLVLVAIAAVLASYHESLASPPSSMGWFSFLATLTNRDPLLIRVIILTVAAVTIISVALWWRPAQSFLSAKPAQILGGYSFAVYLVHVPIISSLGAAVYLAIFPIDRHLASIVALFSSLSLSFLLAWPIMKIDHWWVKILRDVSLSRGSAR